MNLSRLRRVFRSATTTEMLTLSLSSMAAKLRKHADHQTDMGSELQEAARRIREQAAELHADARRAAVADARIEELLGA